MRIGTSWQRSSRALPLSWLLMWIAPRVAKANVKRPHYQLIVMTILATVRLLGDFDGNPFKKRKNGSCYIILHLGWRKFRKRSRFFKYLKCSLFQLCSSGICRCHSDGDIQMHGFKPTHLQTPWNPKWHPSEPPAFMENALAKCPVFARLVFVDTLPSNMAIQMIFRWEMAGKRSIL